MSRAKREESGQARSLRQRLWDFLFERLGLDSAESLAAKKKVPVHRSTPFYFLGGMALFLFGVQIVTGILLALYYKPSPDQAFESVQAIMTEINYGWLMRSVHSWSANLLIGILFLHLMTTFMMRAYRRPREFTYITGILLLGLFMAFGFSGYLLPWNELAFFATRVGTKIVGVVPVIGGHLLLLARGGENVTGDTLARFYALHVVVFPMLTFALMGVHLFLVQKHGMSVPSGSASDAGGEEKVPTMPFVPHFLLRDAVGWYIALGILAALAAIFPWELGVKANPFGSAPAGIKPEWYFLFMFQTLKELPAHIWGFEGEVLGVLFFGACGGVVLLVPFLDLGNPCRRVLMGLAGVAVAFFIVMTAWGWFTEELLYATILGVFLTAGVVAMMYFFVSRKEPGLLTFFITFFAGIFFFLAEIRWEFVRNLFLGSLLAIAMSAGLSGTLQAQEAPAAPKASEAQAKETEAKEASATPEVPKANAPLPEDYSCTFCHGDKDMFFGDKENLLVTEEKLRADIHWKNGLRCHDCHGGNPDPTAFVDHREDPSFHTVATPKDVPGFCGRCHSDINYMRKFGPSARTDQEKEYLTSGHGKALMERGDESVATCVSCHSHHGILAVDNQKSPVYPTHVAQTCAHCHADAKLMDGRKYEGRPLGHEQYAQWSKSVHAQALLEKGDLSAPTCNDCHGNHGALPPEVGSVANACATCHTKMGTLFAETQMKHKFQEVGLPGCATCHGSHDISVPTDAMLGMSSGSVCAKCHEEGKEEGKYGATLAGTEAAEKMRKMMDDLKARIATAKATIEEAENLGMPVDTPRFDLRQAEDALTNARSLIHSFALDPVQEALEKGDQAAEQVQASANAALEEHTARRIWLAAFLIPVLIVVALLVLYVRSAFPVPDKVEGADGQRSDGDSST